MTVAGLATARTEPDERALSRRLSRAIGWIAFGAGMVLRLVALWFTIQMSRGTVPFGLGVGPPSFIASDILGTASGIVGAIIVARRPANLVGWLYVLAGAMQSVLTSGLASYAVIGLTDPSTPTFVFAWLSGVVDFSIPFSFAGLVLALFPDGRLVGPRWRIVVVLAVVGELLRALEVGFGEPAIPLLAGATNPYRLAGGAGDLLQASSRLGVGSVIVEGVLVLASISLVVRYRAASVDGRRQIRWILLAGFVAIIGAVPLALGSFVPGSVPPDVDVISILFLALTLAPVTTLIAITRYRLYEIDRIVNRALLYGTLTAILAGVFTAGVGLAQRLFVLMTGVSSDWAIVLTTLVVATLYAPLRKRLEALVDRHFKFDQMRFGAYGHELTELLGLVDSAFAARRLIGEAVRELGASGGAVLARDGTVTASAGAWPTEVAVRLPIAEGSRAIASIALGPRSGGPSGFRQADLDELARVATLAVRATRAPRATT